MDSLSKNEVLHIANLAMLELSDDEICTIDSFNINARVRYDPDNCDFTIL